MQVPFHRRLLWVALAALLGSCGGKEPTSEGEQHPGPEEKIVRVYNRPGYVAERTAPGFQALTGIRVDYDLYESRPVIETRLLVGKSGYDVVVTSASFLGRQAHSGVFLELDRDKLPNLVNMDPGTMEQVALHDPGNLHAVPYLWGTTGIGYNPDRVRKALGGNAIDSWSAIFKPENAARFKDCGIAISDIAEDVLDAALIYLGRDPNGERQEDLTEAETLLLGILPYVRYLDPAQAADELARGELCVVLGRSGDMLKARERGAAENPPVNVAFAVPAEGATVWLDVIAIPEDAPHPANAHAFINHLMDPQVIAEVTNSVKFANGNAASLGKVDALLRDDPAVYPNPDARTRLHPQLAKSQEYGRLADASWGRIRGRP